MQLAATLRTKKDGNIRPNLSFLNFLLSLQNFVVMKRLLFAASMLTVCLTHAQNHQSSVDTVNGGKLDSIIVSSSMRLNHIPYIKAVEGTNIYAGKKTNSVILDPAEANLAANISRQLFSQIPRITIWEMSGSGTQINIGSRGTDAHRSIEMNMRQNGYNINSDVFGYPEAHYTPAMQGVQKVELVRGSAALQFGSQFDGMLNYQMKEGDSTRPFSLEAEQTVGSFNFFASFTSIRGKRGKWSYYAYCDSRRGDGWRKNAFFGYHGYYANVYYAFSSKGSLALQFSRMDYLGANCRWPDRGTVQSKPQNFTAQPQFFFSLDSNRGPSACKAQRVLLSLI